MEANTQKIYALLTQAVYEAQQRNKGKVAELMDEAIHLTEVGGGTSITLNTMRERLLMESYQDIPRFINALSAELAFYEEANVLTGQIDTLRNLGIETLRIGNKEKSLDFLNAAEGLLDNLQESQLAQICLELGAENVRVSDDFIRTRKSMISKIKSQIQ